MALESSSPSDTISGGSSKVTTQQSAILKFYVTKTRIPTDARPVDIIIRESCTEIEPRCDTTEQAESTTIIATSPVKDELAESESESTSTKPSNMSNDEGNSATKGRSDDREEKAEGESDHEQRVREAGSEEEQVEPGPDSEDEGSLIDGNSGDEHLKSTSVHQYDGEEGKAHDKGSDTISAENHDEADEKEDDFENEGNSSPSYAFASICRSGAGCEEDEDTVVVNWSRSFPAKDVGLGSDPDGIQGREKTVIAFSESKEDEQQPNPSFISPFLPQETPSQEIIAPSISTGSVTPINEIAMTIKQEPTDTSVLTTPPTREAVTISNLQSQLASLASEIKQWEQTHHSHTLAMKRHGATTASTSAEQATNMAESRALRAERKRIKEDLDLKLAKRRVLEQKLQETWTQSKAVEKLRDEAQYRINCLAQKKKKLENKLQAAKHEGEIVERWPDPGARELARNLGWQRESESRPGNSEGWVAQKGEGRWVTVAERLAAGGGNFEDLMLLEDELSLVDGKVKQEENEDVNTTTRAKSEDDGDTGESESAKGFQREVSNNSSLTLSLLPTGPPPASKPTSGSADTELKDGSSVTIKTEFDEEDHITLDMVAHEAQQILHRRKALQGMLQVMQGNKRKAPERESRSVSASASSSVISTEGSTIPPPPPAKRIRVTKRGLFSAPQNRKGKYKSDYLDDDNDKDSTSDLEAEYRWNGKAV